MDTINRQQESVRAVIALFVLTASFVGCESADYDELRDDEFGSDSSSEDLAHAGASTLATQNSMPSGLNFPPPVDGFGHPISITGYANADQYDGIDGFYNAQDWGVYNGSFGGHHCGEDWNYDTGGNSDYGAPVYATANGIVRNSAHYGSGYGNFVLLEHYIPGAGDPAYRFITSTYGHLANRSVSVGDVVVRGQQIGTIGTADGAYSAHLHFEMRWDETLGPIANAGYGCSNVSSGTFDPSDFIDTHRSWSPTFEDWSFCTAENPCGPAEGDCDEHSHCLAGSSCVDNVGSKYGWSASVDVCESACHTGALGGWSYCSEGCPCGIGEGDCDSNDECIGDLICRSNVGANYGMPAGMDVCEQCHADTFGGYHYCSIGCPCEEGEGDCDSDNECAGSLQCIHNIGAQYGWPANTDVCGTP